VFALFGFWEISPMVRPEGGMWDACNVIENSLAEMADRNPEVETKSKT
jgi:hypothetical protein